MTALRESSRRTVSAVSQLDLGKQVDRFDGDALQTVVLSRQDRVAHAPLLAFDVDPAVRDEPAERQRWRDIPSYFRAPGSCCTLVPGGEVVSRRAVAVAGDRWIRESVRPLQIPEELRVDGSDELRIGQPERELDGEAVLLAYGGGGVRWNYYQFLLQGLPRLWTAQEAGVDVDRLPVIVRGDAPPVEAQAFDLIGLSPERRVPWEGEHLRCEYLYVPSRGVSGSSKQSVAGVQALRRLALEVAEPTGERPRIFITRAAAPNKRVINEAELVEVARRYGFRIVDTATLSLLEQIRLFRDAEIVCAPHGAGLANLVFAPSDCLIVELFGEKVPFAWKTYRRLAGGRGQGYALQIGPRAPGHERSDWQVADYRIDPQRFRRLMRQVDDFARTNRQIER